MEKYNIFELLEGIYDAEGSKKIEVCSKVYSLLEDAGDYALEQVRSTNPNIDFLRAKVQLDLLLKDFETYKICVEQVEVYSPNEDEDIEDENSIEEDNIIKEATDIKKFANYEELRVIEGDRWSGRKIRGFRLNKKFYEVKRFSIMLVQVITLLYELDKQRMLEDIVDVLTIKGSKGGVYISKSNEGMAAYEEIGEEIYINKGLGIGVMAKVIERLLEAYGYFYWDFGIYVLKEDKA